MTACFRDKDAKRECDAISVNYVIRFRVPVVVIAIGNVQVCTPGEAI